MILKIGNIQPLVLPPCERNWNMRLYSQHFIFFLTYEWAQKAIVLHYPWLKGFSSEKHSSLFGARKKMKCCENGSKFFPTFLSIPSFSTFFRLKICPIFVLILHLACSTRSEIGSMSFGLKQFRRLTFGRQAYCLKRDIV